MKIIFISIVSIILSLDLFARENPFEPTDTFIEIQKQYIITQENKEIERKKIDYELNAKKLEEKTKQQLLAQELIEKEKQENAKKLLEKIKLDNKIKEEKAKQKLIAETTKYKILSFINATTTNDKLVINIGKKYKLKNQDILHKNKKFVFDFVGSINMYTKRVKLEHKYFESITIGSHMKDNFFRVVVVLKDVIVNYEENIENSTITIKKIK